MERDTVSKVHAHLDQLTRAAGQVDETLFVMNTYLFYKLTVWRLTFEMATTKQTEDNNLKCSMLPWSNMNLFHILYKKNFLL